MNDTPTSTTRRFLPATSVYTLAAFFLAVGLVSGFLARGPRAHANTAVATSPAGMGRGQAPTLEEMKQMADNQAAPLLEKLKANPNDAALLAQIGSLYHTTHQFTDAAGYYRKAAQIDPSNVALRTKLAASLYRGGDADGAIEQLNQALRYSPGDANTLFNLGLIRWQGKQDSHGALAAWRQLLKSNPQLGADRKATVQHLIAQAEAGATAQPATERSIHP